MAAKKSAKKSAKKNVTVSIDPEALRALADASEALAELATGIIWWIDDRDVRAKLTKGRKRPSKKRR
jgi:hypothetical protein